MTSQSVCKVAGLSDVEFAWGILKDVDGEICHEKKKPQQVGRSRLAGPTAVSKNPVKYLL